MKNLGWIVLVLILFAALFLGVRWHYVCNMLDMCHDTEISADDNSLKLTYKDSVLLTGYDHFAFDSMKADANLTPNNLEFLKKVAAVMAARPELDLEIIGNYRNNEDGGVGMYENMGTARANIIRDSLAAMGLSSNRIFLDHNQVDLDALEMLSFRLIDRAEENNAVAEEYDENSDAKDLGREQYSFKNMVFQELTFDKNKSNFKPNEAFIAYVDSVSTYVSENPGVSITLEGHTDSDGGYKLNENLGLRRAKAVRSYMVKNAGITEKTISVESKGEMVPIAKNHNADGSKNETNMRKNRRVKIIINDEMPI